VDLSFDPLKSRIIDLIEILDEICSIYPVQVSVCVVPKPFWTIHSRKIKAGYLGRWMQKIAKSKTQAGQRRIHSALTGGISRRPGIHKPGRSLIAFCEISHHKIGSKVLKKDFLNI
jgi:hypothetical protein